MDDDVLRNDIILVVAGETVANTFKCSMSGPMSSPPPIPNRELNTPINNAKNSMRGWKRRVKFPIRKQSVEKGISYGK